MVSNNYKGSTCDYRFFFKSANDSSYYMMIVVVGR